MLYKPQVSDRVSSTLTPVQVSQLLHAKRLGTETGGATRASVKFRAFRRSGSASCSRRIEALGRFADVRATPPPAGEQLRHRGPSPDWRLNLRSCQRPIVLARHPWRPGRQTKRWSTRWRQSEPAPPPRGRFPDGWRSHWQWAYAPIVETTARGPS